MKALEALTLIMVGVMLGMAMARPEHQVALTLSVFWALAVFAIMVRKRTS